MSDKISLAFCVHSHQPVGNFSWVFDMGARDCYLPFLETLIGYPQLRMTLHYTGALLEWFAQHKPEFYDLLQEMVSRGQVEFMGGGFYEPILAVIPEDDAKGQIAMHTAFSEERFGRRPRGIWCAERIWDPCLPKKIAGTGIEYTLLDDSHFLASGLSPQDIHGYYLTEREGHQLKIFPIDMQLRYMIPFRQPQETIDYLLRLRDRGVRIATYGDDGEKFGMWPGTFKWVYDEGWLRRFFDALSKVTGDIEVVTLSQALDRCAPQGRVYLPTASYQEMMEWSLFCEQGRYYEQLIKEAKQAPDWDARRAFLRGGIWDNFLSKYPESNAMHKKMLKISALAHAHGAPSQAMRHIYRSQCNCAYWHGLFGGVYLGMLRHANYENMLKAEELIDQKRLQDRTWIIEHEDHDFDGKPEIVISGKKLNCQLVPHAGGALTGLEFKPRHYNLSNVMMRHPEIYHEKILNDTGSHAQQAAGEPLSIHDIPFTVTDELREMLVYDAYPRYTCLSHILSCPVDPGKLLRGRRLNRSLVYNKQFDLVRTLQEGDVLSVSLACTGDLGLEKTFILNPEGAITLEHNIDAQHAKQWLAVEFNFMVFGATPLVRGRKAAEKSTHHAGKIVFKDQDNDLELCISSAKPWDIVVLPIECASQSESGFEKTFQGWSVFFIREISGKIPAIELHMGAVCPS